MSAERLSKLQKWILKKVYIWTIDEPCLISIQRLKRCARDAMKGEDEDDVGERPFADGDKNSWNSINATFSRSIKNLYFKKLIDVASGTNPEDGTLKICTGIEDMKEFATGDPHCGVNAKFILGLTDEGRVKAKRLLNVKK